MPFSSWKTSLAFGAVTLGLAGCMAKDADPGREDKQTPIAERVEVREKILADTTWSAGKTYVLKDHIFVEAGTLTIEAGTRIEGDGRSSLVVTTGGKLSAVGTREKPIVFTSSKPEGTRAPADWGGVVLLGTAAINVAGGTSSIEGFPDSQPGIRYGGSDDAHDCGKLRYARIEFAGFKLTDNNELNGLTVGGCGSATEIDFVQVHKGADDGVEMFGGTANLKHVVITQPDDDGLDWDIGYRGKVQYLIVQQNADVGNCGFEGDNNPNNPAAATPRSSPEIWNATLIGSNRDPGTAGKKQLGMHLKNGTAGKLSNVLMASFTDAAVDIDRAPAVAMFASGELQLKHSLFWDNQDAANGLGFEATDNDEGFVEEEQLLASANANRVADPLLRDAYNLLQPQFGPAAGSPALVGGGVPSGEFFDAQATFVGAIGEDDWTTGWTAYPAN